MKPIVCREALEEAPVLERRVIQSGYDRKRCWVHARCGVIPQPGGANWLVMTLQENVMASCEDLWDVFRSPHVKISQDGGLTWSAPKPDPGLLGWEEPGGVETVISDFTPQWHRATGRLLGLGHTCRYRAGALLPQPRPRQTVFSVFDPETLRWNPARLIRLEDEERFFCAGAGSIQWWEEPDGTLLVPIYFRDLSMSRGGDDRARLPFKVVVLRCAFDGETVSVLEIGPELAVCAERGLMEPSLVKWRGRYWLTLRGGVGAFVATSDDGFRFETPQAWRFDDGEALGSVDTQQHWLLCGERLFLVYTNRGWGNDHIVRHRAPLLIAEVVEGSGFPRLLRVSERVAIPERGAQLGNFGVCQNGNDEAWIVASEWMENAGEWNPFVWNALKVRYPLADLPRLAALPGRCGLCELGGSDNAIHLVRVTPGHARPPGPKGR